MAQRMKHHVVVLTLEFDSPNSTLDRLVKNLAEKGAWDSIKNLIRPPPDPDYVGIENVIMTTMSDIKTRAR